MFLDSQMIRRLGVIASLATQVGVYVILGALFGGWLDEKAGLEMIFQIIFTLLGLITGFYRLISYMKNDATNSK